MALVLCLGWPSELAAYAVLAHEAIIDSVWDTNIRPLLLKRFPGATAEEIKEAHGYAYGGAIIQDMGYYPHGSFFFSDLTHYVRSGDFVLALLHDSKDLNGYAFALGSLAHYAADNNGHPMGTNRAVPILYPKLKQKYGDSVTYEQDRLAQLSRVLEARKGREMVEKLKDNSLSVYKKETQALEQKMLDDLSATQFGRLDKQNLPTASSSTRKS